MPRLVSPNINPKEKSTREAMANASDAMPRPLLTGGREVKPEYECGGGGRKPLEYRPGEDGYGGDRWSPETGCWGGVNGRLAGIPSEVSGLGACWSNGCVMVQGFRVS
jgi:hypothetical protein